MIQRDVDPVKDKQVNKMLDAKFGKQNKSIVTGDALRTVKALLEQSVKKRAITKHPGHPDQSVHGSKQGARRKVKAPQLARRRKTAHRGRVLAGQVARALTSPVRAGKAGARAGRALKPTVSRARRIAFGATPLGMSRAGARAGFAGWKAKTRAELQSARRLLTGKKKRSRKMTKTEQVNSIIKRLNEIITTEKQARRRRPSLGSRVRMAGRRAAATAERVASRTKQRLESPRGINIGPANIRSVKRPGYKPGGIKGPMMPRISRRKPRRKNY